jgi:uncharacterized membrane protein YkvA (DUF1232 family)
MIIKTLKRMKYELKKVYNDGRILIKVIKDPDCPIKVKIIGFGFVVYLISPIDIIPNFIPFLGILDDIIIFKLIIPRIKKMVPDLWAKYEKESI